MQILSGIDMVEANPSLLDNLGRVGLVTNQAACNKSYLPCVQAFFEACSKAKNSSLVALFGPQHGYWQTEQDNMLETPDLQFSIHTPELTEQLRPPQQRLPLYSLYSETRIPTPQQLTEVDTLVVDLIDVGCRIYTYMLTLAACMRAAAKAGKKVVVLDRPNPIGLCYRDPMKGAYLNVEGNLLRTRWHSFVGWYDIPMRHGLSLGELGNYFKFEDKLDLDYCVIKAQNLFRNTSHAELSNMAWTTPSPNLPTWQTAVLFSSFVMLEGTNISEGRGTTLPFVTLGAPFIDADELICSLRNMQKRYAGDPALGLDGLIFRRHDFRPTFNKHKSVWCKGIQIHLDLRRSLQLQHNAFALGILTLAQIIAQHTNEFQWKAPGYEYNNIDAPINLILGDDAWLISAQKFIHDGRDKRKFFDELEKLLISAHKEGQEFALRTEFTHMYS